jgi:hypothetical protein
LPLAITALGVGAGALLGWQAEGAMSAVGSYFLICAVLAVL